jgi:hypothetical protein
MSAPQAFELNQNEAGLVLAQHFSSATRLGMISISANWGPPIGGRFDEDFLVIWFAVDEELQPKEVLLYGTDPYRPNDIAWSECKAFSKLGVVDAHNKTFGLYYFSDQPVEQFVICVNDAVGRSYYDNNGGFGMNYRIKRYGGLQLNIVRSVSGAGESSILLFPRLVGLAGSSRVAAFNLA